MVSNFNLTWKNACLEILNYVRCFISLSDGVVVEQKTVQREDARIVHPGEASFYGMEILDRCE